MDNLANWEVAAIAILGMSVLFTAIVKVKNFFLNGIPKKIDELDRRADRHREDIIKLTVLVEQLVKSMDEESGKRKEIYDRILQLEKMK